ncbi:TonB-dependent receptor [Sphingobium sp.]|uniref:TonB-dependent receptor n=1 Tax=Sphingobium sp. TaxID=1912891 RepID=UPI0028BEBE37|nr:TonB-dependent receptor [Sphingobium sp.]
MNGKMLLKLGGCTLALAAAPTMAWAQAATDDSTATADIIVTATKQNSTLAKTPAAITAISAADLGPGGTTDIGDLQASIPNVSIGSQYGVNRTFIRGIGMTSIDLGGDGAVAFLQDGAILPRPSMQLSGFYDLEQIEVLRGPQGTLYGRGATAGAINLITKKPTNELDGYLRLTYGNYDARTAEGAIGGALVDDKLLVRVSGKYEKRDGYGKNLFNGHDIDDRDAYSFRGTLLWRISPDASATVIVDHTREKDNNYGFHFFGPTVVPLDQFPHTLIGGSTIFDYYAARGEKPNLRNVWSDQDPVNRRKGTGVTGIIDVTSGDLTLKSVTAYHDFHRFNRNDLDASEVNMYGQNNYVEDSKSYSQELTATYNGEGFNLLAGAMYFHETLFGQVLVPTTNFGLVLGLPADTFNNGAYEQRGTVKTDAYGIYLQGTVDLTSRLKLTAGVRYNSERRAGIGFFVFDPAGINIPTDRKKTWPAFTPKFVLEYTPSDDALLYATVARGFKSGVINVGSLDSAIDPEYVWDYEAGFKVKFADRRLLLSGAVFYYDYTNLQVSFVNAQSIVQTINAASARNYGAELELSGKVTDHLAINAYGSYLNARFTKFCNGYYGAGLPARPGISYAPCPTDPGIVDLSGKRLPSAPSYTAGAGMSWDIPLADSAKFVLDGDLSYVSKVYFNEFNNRDAEQDGYVNVNLNATYHASDDRWTAGVWAKNLTNEYVIANNIVNAATYAFPRTGSLMPPRTYGATVSVKF